MDRIDFRSDTVTWPTPEMREAMATAEVGDDVYGEDPTVNRLEGLAAELTGKQAGLFVASGTMGNLAAILTHARRGDEAIVADTAHTWAWEAGGMAALGGVIPHTLPADEDGRLAPADVAAAVREDDPHLAHTRLLLLENTFGGAAGAPLPPAYFSRLREVATRHGLATHLDGARLFNAARALDVDLRELTDDVDSVTFCLSKGLCAPAGSVLCGSRDFIHRARRVRKTLGGGMRQAGILAAAGIVGLETMVERLDEDHTHARMLAEGLAAIPGIDLDPSRTRTNIVHFELEDVVELDREGLIARLREEHGIGLSAYPPRYLRAVTHRWVGAAEIDLCLAAIRSIVAPNSPTRGG